ncbi:histidine phosphatase family protein [Streptomyces sp. NBC_01262]|uniref:histidine phosphatase family protein n=1 Tax=Streptomyces sp. NBC_01262 TaxID=2903803 RepID=UPI002E315125|nr:histidine phosphatase family protein [Streptomyces sp. NBC_01262]
MTEGATRYLYLARHGQALPDESGLTETGRRQAVLLGERLREVPISVVHHGPLARASQTASLIAGQLDGAPLRRSEVAGDYVPYMPDKDELPEETAGYLLRFLDWVTEEDREEGAALAAQALERFTGPAEGPAGEERHELVVTHNFLVGWLVRAALDAPKWRWLGLNHGNAALTVIRYTPGRLPALLSWNDSGHIPAGLRTL